MMKNLLAVVCIAAAVGSPAQVKAQAATPPVAVPPTMALSKPMKAPQKHPVFRHPTAAQRGLSPSDLVAVTTASGEKRYMRKKSVKLTK
jgi:hypothetical protein